MKKFVGFVMILSLGLFCAVGCQKKVDTKKETKPPVTAPADEKAPAEAAESTEKPAGFVPPAAPAEEKPK